jgi:integrase
MKQNPFKIITHTYESGETAYRVTGMLNGKQIRKNFSTNEEAVTAKGNYERELMNLAPVPMVNTRLTPEQAREAELIYAEMKGFPFPMSALDLVKWGKANYSDPQKKITASDAFTKFIADKTAANLRPATLRKLKQRVGTIAKAFPDKLVSDLQPDALKTLIFRDGSGNVNRETDYRAFTNFFNWSTLHGYCTANPMSKIEKIKLDREEPVILPMDSVRKLVNAAAAHKDGVCLPYVILGMFCAIRPTELERLTWGDIDLKARTVTLGANIAKMRQRRIVEISNAAAAWLTAHSIERTPIKGTNWRKDFDRIKEAAGYGTATEKKPYLKPWTPDAMRHTGISYHLAQHQHEGKTAAWAGNSPNIIHQCYKGLVKRSDARAFWNITAREKPGKILKLKAA